MTDERRKLFFELLAEFFDEQPNDLEKAKQRRWRREMLNAADNHSDTAHYALTRFSKLGFEERP